MSPDYRKMYALLCTAIDRSIDPLKRIPQAYPIADALERALAVVLRRRLEPLMLELDLQEARDTALILYNENAYRLI